MRVDPKKLVSYLDKAATQALEMAIGIAVSSEHAEVGVDHLALALFQGNNDDIKTLLDEAGVQSPKLVLHIEKALRSERYRTEARPVFAPSLFRWIEDTWLLASIEVGLRELPPAALIAALSRRWREYTATDLGELDPLDLHVRRVGLGKYVSTNSVVADNHSAVRSEDTSILQKFCRNFTMEARAQKLDRVYGRHNEIRQLIDILARRRKNNPLVVGEPGVGKTALVEGLAHAIVDEEVPSFLRNTDILGLDLGLLQAGASMRGEFEKRLHAVIEAVKANPVQIILFIDEAHTLIGAGNAQGGTDAANLLKPALARGELRTIAATTWSEYKKYFEKDAALERRFQPVKVGEPSVDETITMLRGLRPSYEEAHGVHILNEAIEAAARFAAQYIAGRHMPDKAVDLLDTAAARTRVDRDALTEADAGLRYELEAARRKHALLERDFGIGRKDVDECLQGASEALERLEQAVDDSNKSRNALNGASAANPDEEKNTPIVDVDAVARAVAAWTGIPVGRMTRANQATSLRLDAALSQRVIGQDAAIRVVSEAMRIAVSGIRPEGSPLATMLFVGPSGVGKTETAHALADELFGGASFLTVINMTEFSEKHTVSRLIGSPPGYVGYGEGGMLSEAVRQRPYGVVLLDECEKAHPEVMNLFYQVFDKGVLTDSEGRSVSFANTVVIMTSNLATDIIMRCPSDITDEALISEIRPALSRHFKPALLGRMQVVPYRPLEKEQIKSIARLKLRDIVNRIYLNHGVEPSVDESTINLIAMRCDDPDSGARNIDAVLRATLVPRIARKLLEANVEGSAIQSIYIAASPDGNFDVSIESS